MNLAKAAATVGGFTMLSRILGFVRDILIAAMLGAGPLADAFVVAFRIPNLFRRLVAEGAFTAAFVPMFSRRLEASGKEAARAFGEQVFSVMLVTVGLFTLLAEIFMPYLMYGLAPGFSADADKFALAVELTRITFPYLLAMALVSLLGGMLNAVYRFAAMAAAPVLLNIILIAALAIVVPLVGLPGQVLAWGVAVAGLAQLVYLMVASAREGLRPRLVRPRFDAAIRRLLTLMLPAALGAGVTQINIVVGTMIASFLSTGAIAHLYYADRVYQLPLGVIGIAIGTALLPLLSRQLRAGEDGAAMQSLNRGLEFSLLLTLPAAVALATIAGPIAIVLFERGAFTAADSMATAGALAAYAFGLPAFVLVKVLAPPFFAREDTRTPVIVATAAVAANIALSLALIGPLGHVGIALATTLAGWLNALLLMVLLHRRDFLAADPRFRRRFPRIVLAATLMGAALLAARPLVMPMLADGPTMRIAVLIGLVAGGALVFAISVTLGGGARPADLKALFRREPSAAAKPGPDADAGGDPS
ncbi:murein biosynthesis integral membrane protein MurJ [Oceanibacterium hippocampi]|uniref:Probable lipid II flippase MurJ n=1 Tax=Oceanibacterium hippocampi TaxID=745714 RepID=A0A1Y5RKV0_9PROT|nr:murein biosynthesis integral membrane protein MurJ [Oceanibacterium hippocampi]SLN19643.1 putative peptidoglycan biosynthesis protein MurJ [Oceanibacterium hippocampi]